MRSLKKRKSTFQMLESSAKLGKKFICYVSNLNMKYAFVCSRTFSESWYLDVKVFCL